MHSCPPAPRGGRYPYLIIIPCRQKRLAEFSTISQKSVHGRVYPLQKPDYARDVTAGSKDATVLVFLSSGSSSNTESRLLAELWRQTAEKYADIKFCQIRGDMCIEGYPERNCPTILVYKNEDIVKQIVTLAELGGTSTRLEGTFLSRVNPFLMLSP